VNRALVTLQNQHGNTLMQVRDDAPGPLSKWYRHISKGAWPFSTRDHGWPISDCSAEGVKVRHGKHLQTPSIAASSIRPCCSMDHVLVYLICCLAQVKFTTNHPTMQGPVFLQCTAAEILSLLHGHQLLSLGVRQWPLLRD
jgi:hypothetical protein